MYNTRTVFTATTATTTPSSIHPQGRPVLGQVALDVDAEERHLRLKVKLLVRLVLRQQLVLREENKEEIKGK